MDHHTTRALAAAALALTLGACSDLSTNPAAARIAGAAPSRDVSASAPRLFANSVKYRDHGGKPATGRSGSAQLQALALVDKNGVTEVEILALPPGGGQYGTITRAQIKGLDADSALLFTRNLNGVDSHYLPLLLQGVMRGNLLQVQANVTDADPHRTGVVTLTERVKARPDLAARLTLGPEVPAMQRVVVTATVAELNGDVGARTDCRLWVDGRFADWALGIWVDAGDAVTCAFTHSFDPGEHEVYVDLGSVQPGDWDYANNVSDTVRVRAVGGVTEFDYFAVAREVVARQQNRWEDHWYDGARGVRGEQVSTFDLSSAEEIAGFDGTIPRGLTGAVTIDISQQSGDRTLHQASWTLDDMQSTLCTSRSDESTYFYLCSFPGSTYFGYRRNAGAVTYHASEYSRTWDELTGEEQVWSWNDTYESSYGTLAGYGDDYAFQVRVADAGAVLTAESRFPLEHTVTVDRRDECQDYEDYWTGLTGRRCTWLDWSHSDRFGFDRRPR